MANKLVIVESPGKVKAIKKFLGRNYTVEASMGHLRDLPKSRLGVDVDNDYEPKYINIRGKGDLIRNLKKKAANADKIFLATDPDREGEAISWHLTHLLGMNPEEKCRIEFNEITKDAVKNAIKKPRAINMNLVDAQQARRVLDRVVGYKLSPLLWRKVKKGLSAGRVQSVTTRIICDREREIDEFIPREYWSLKGDFKPDGKKDIITADIWRKNNKKIEPANKEQVDDILNDLNNADYYVKSLKKTDKTRKAAPPFITSTLQQDAYSKLNMTTRRTMMIAQQLYEGVDIKGKGTVGLITYMRTDSVRVSDEAVSQIREIIKDAFGTEYIPVKPNTYKGKKSAQDAHEAIRPTYADLKPEDIKQFLDKTQYRLYNLIYKRFMASQMTPAKYESVTLEIANKDNAKNEYLFKANGSRLLFLGFQKAYGVKGKGEKDKILPPLDLNQIMELMKWNPEQHFTQPPPRYTEASLVRTMEDKGIGRPSTYAPTIGTIISRGYIVRDQKVLIPTELGMLVNDLINKHFKKVVDYNFTAMMENELDQVEEGKFEWKRVLREFYPEFAKLVEKAEKEIPEVEIKPEISDVLCDKCGTNMVIKMGRYGKFLACPAFPECRNTKPLVQEIDTPCPKCGAVINIRRSKKGRMFYGCSKYPECDFVSWDYPLSEKCPKCGEFTVMKKGRNGNSSISCSAKNCDYRKTVKKEKE